MSLFGYQPPATLKWNDIEPSIRDGDAQEALSTGCPSGRGHSATPCPMLPACQMIWCDALSRDLGFLIVAPIARNVATTSPSGSRILSPTASLKAREPTRASSTGRIW